MSESLSTFVSALGESARPTQFKVTINFPVFVSNSTDATRASQTLTFQGSIPASTIEDIAVMYRGRQIHEAGERSYQAWTATVYNDINFTVRAALEEWSNYIRLPEATGGAGSPVEYKSTVTVEQLNRSGETVRTYKLIGAYPQDIQAIELSYSSTSELENYVTTWMYDYFEISEA